MPILKRRNSKLCKLKSLAQYHVFMNGHAWIHTEVDLTPKPGHLLLCHSEGMGKSVRYACTGCKGCAPGRRDEKQADSANCRGSCTNSPYSWEVVDSGHCPRGTFRTAGFREVGGRVWGAPCLYPLSIPFLLPTYFYCWVWAVDRDAGLGGEDPFPLGCAVCGPSCRQPQSSGAWICASCCWAPHCLA